MKTVYTSSKLFLLVISLVATLTNSNAQNVGINSSGASGHPSAMLDVSASDKGVLFPNVTLTAEDDASTITNPATGLMVWNTGTGFGTAGYYYNNGTSVTPNWTRVNNSIYSAGNGISLSGVGVISNTGVLSLSGTTNQVNVSSTVGNITLTTPQDIHAGASPTFVGITATGLNTAGVVTNTASGVLGTTSLADLMADLTPGAGLTGTTIYDGSSAQTFSVASGNGLTTDSAQDRVKLGGTLDENTTISKGNFGLTINQTGTGDFEIQDNGGSSLFIYGNDGLATDGNVGIGFNTPTYKLSVNGTIEAIDFGPAGSQNIRVGDDSYLTDIDIAHTLGIYSTSTTGLGRIALGASTEIVERTMDQTASFGSANNFVFDDFSTSAAAIVVESGSSESGGFFANGNTAAIWSPGDGTGGILSIYDEDNMNITTPAVRIEGDGDLRMYSDNSIHMPNNVGYVINRGEQYFASSNTTYVNVAGTTSALQVDANDIVIINVTLKFKFVNGSGNDDVRFRINYTGCSSGNQADTYEFENFDNDRDEYQPIALQYVHVSTCNGTLQFNVQMDAFSDADDNVRVADVVITATKY